MTVRMTILGATALLLTACGGDDAANEPIRFIAASLTVGALGLFGAVALGADKTPPGATAVPRRNSSAFIGCLPARCTSISRTAPSRHAMVRRSSSTVPGAPAPSPRVVCSTLMRAPASSNRAS